jgi:hypothetical protein
MNLLTKGCHLLFLLIILTGPDIAASPAIGKPSLLPAPRIVKWTSEKFRCNAEDPLIDPRVRRVTVASIHEASLNMEEAYRLVVRADSVLIYATGEEGFFRAQATLNQLSGRDSSGQFLAGCSITDWPAFRIRGFMHDCGRSFIPVDELKREVQILSAFKINTFHWHLTEDIAWRLESEVIPGLTGEGVSLRDKQGFYTREDIRDFVSFCKKHFVEVIPEIDMPGHSAAFTRATGHTMQSHEGKVLVEKLLNEACRLFDGDYFHIGTDEVKIADPDFVTDMMSVVRSHGKEVIGWLPGGEMDRQAIRHLWADVSMPQNTSVIDSRYRYLNHTDYYSDLFALYNSRLCDSPSGSDLLAGGICSIWNDRKPASVEDILVSNAFYPMMLAFSERAWSGGGDDIKTRGVRMGMPGDPAFERFRDFESRMMAVRERSLTDVPFPYLAQSQISWKISSQIPNYGNTGWAAPFENELVKNPGDDVSPSVRFAPAAGAAVYLRHVWGDKVPSFYSDPRPDQTAYAYTWVYSPSKGEAGLHFSTHNYGRSELDAAPPAGEWDYKRSRVWFNGEPVTPPSWDNQGIRPDHETPYSNEDIWSRPPVSINLREGWNSLVIKLPVGRFSTPETRLVKWMFTAMIVNPDGKDQPEGIVYSPQKLLPEERIEVACIGNYGGLSLPEAWSDNMVLQHDRSISLSGMADRNEPVEVSIAERVYATKASATGEWNVQLEPLKSGGPYQLRVTTPDDSVVLRNILAGEVWLCSGQSNMEWSAGNSDGWDEIPSSYSDELLRINNFKHRQVNWNESWDSLTLSEINNLEFFEKGEWMVASRETADDFSAVAWYFGRRLRAELGMPVGLIELAVGGSPAEAWIERKALEVHPQLVDLLYDYRKSEYQDKWVKDAIASTLQLTDNPRQRHPFEPAYLFEAGISKLAGFPVRGFLWYQGESNANFPELYEVMLPEMVRNWRDVWNDAQLPFYYAQLSSLNRPSWPAFRDSQRRLAGVIPFSGMVVTTDVGHPTDVHPRDKKSVGERFADLALKETYGKGEFRRSPEPYKAELKNGKIIISFRHTWKLRTSDGLPVREIEISSTGNYYIPAKAVISRNRIMIESADAVSVRYGWKPYSEGNLAGESGLPVATFKLKIN